MSRTAFPHPPVCITDWARIGLTHQVLTVEKAVALMVNWPRSKKRDRAEKLLGEVALGKGDVVKAKAAFEAAAKEARVWSPYRGP